MRRLRIGFLLLGAVALGWLVVHVGPRVLWRGLQQVGWGLALGSGCHLAGLLLDAITMRACAVEPRPRFGLALRAGLTGHALNEATPGGKLGELTKYAVLDEELTAAAAAAALIAQNLVMFVVNCALLAAAPGLAILAVGGPPAVALRFAAGGLIFVALGAAVLVVLGRGLGGWPFALLRLIRVPAARVTRWRQRFGGVEAGWRRAAADRRSMALAWSSALLSRLCSVAEAAIYFALAGGDHAIAAGFLSVASFQAVSWILFFVPFQAGSAEGSAYAVFAAAGLSGPTAVVVELARKLRRLGFIALGVALLAVTSLRKRDARMT